MDPFTQNLINRTKQRQEYLKAKQNGQTPSKIATQSENIRTSSPLREASSIPLNGGKISPTRKSTVKEPIELGKENGQLSETTEKSHPINFRSKFQPNDHDIDFVKTSTLKAQEDKSVFPDLISPQKDARKNRLANLAHQINDWEDESYLCSKSASSTPVKNSKDVPKYGASRPSTSTPTKLDFNQRGITVSKTPGTGSKSITTKEEYNKESPSVNHFRKDEEKEKATPTKAVESQGFTPTTSRSRLIYEFEKERGEPVEEEQAKSWTYAAGSPVKNGNRLQTTSSSALSPSPQSPLRSIPKTIVSSSARKEPGSPIRSGPSYSALRSAASPTKAVRNSPLKPAETVASTIKPFSVASPSKSSSRLPVVEHRQSPQKPYISASVSDNGPAVSVLKRAAMFDSPRSVPKDPTELSLSERKALFEKNKGQAPTPKVSTATSAGFRSKAPAPSTPSEATQKFNINKQTLEQSLSAHQNANSAKAVRMKELEELRNRHHHRKQKAAGDTPTRNESPLPETPEPPVEPPPPPPLQSPVKAVVVSPKKEISATVSKPSSATKRSAPVESYPGLDRCKPIRISPPKAGRLYPCLSDLEMTTENESESDSASESDGYEENNQSGKETGALDCSQDMDSSFTVDILGKAGLSHFINTPKRKIEEMQQHCKHERMDAVEERGEDKDESDEMGDISDLLNEALDDPNSEPTPPKQRKNDSDSVGGPYPLYHSVSFYRKQKQEFTTTPIKQVIRNPEVQVEASDDKSSSAESQRIQVNQQIRHLQEEINAQQIVMSQASQALNLCRATAEFSGSTEQVEGERLLLVASQKRQAAVNEIQRLKTEAALRKVSDDLASSGTLSISNLALPLKKEFLAMLSKGGDDFIHYFVILVRSRGQVIPTQMVSTVDGIQDGALLFPNLIQLRDLSADFNVSVEVYALQTRKEKLPHAAKYHIRKESSKMRLTPKKLLNKQESRLLSTPTITSPAGPNAIRSSSFGMVGITSITPATLHRKNWILEKVPFASPIEGGIELKIQSHTDSLIEERGFLTVFEDVGGFGAWHRRWCYLSNDQLLFWKYPDDEKRKEPLAHISLRSCITEHVDVVSRDICARPNTLLLVTVRQPQPGDKDSLVMTCYSHRTALRHLLSADLKEERHMWCKQINRVLANLRAWDPDSLKPSVEGSTPNKSL